MDQKGYQKFIAEVEEDERRLKRITTRFLTVALALVLTLVGFSVWAQRRYAALPTHCAEFRPVIVAKRLRVSCTMRCYTHRYLAVRYDGSPDKTYEFEPHIDDRQYDALQVGDRVSFTLCTKETIKGYQTTYVPVRKISP